MPQLRGAPGAGAAIVAGLRGGRRRHVVRRQLGGWLLSLSPAETRPVDGRLGKEAFVSDLDGDSVTCPTGVASAGSSTVWNRGEQAWARWRVFAQVCTRGPHLPQGLPGLCLAGAVSIRPNLPCLRPIS